MIINIIAAMAANRVIGNNNSLPRNYPEDLKRFKALTSGHVIAMGRKTYESIGRPLPNRRNIVLTSTPIEGVECYSSIEDMIKTLESEHTEELWIIGWANIYSQFIARADAIHMTEIKAEHIWDTYFPAFEASFEIAEKTWNETGEMNFVKYSRRPNKSDM